MFIIIINWIGTEYMREHCLPDSHLSHGMLYIWLICETTKTTWRKWPWKEATLITVAVVRLPISNGKWKTKQKKLSTSTLLVSDDITRKQFSHRRRSCETSGCSSIVNRLGKHFQLILENLSRHFWSVLLSLTRIWPAVSARSQFFSARFIHQKIL